MGSWAMAFHVSAHVGPHSFTFIPGLTPCTLAHCGPSSPWVRFAAAVTDYDATLGPRCLARTAGAQFFPQLTEPSFARHTLDIMTAEGGRLTPDVPRVRLPKPEPPAAETAPIDSAVNHVAI